MTALPVRDTSIRGRPGMAAGTTLQQLAARSFPYALTSTIRCRTDRPGFVVDPAHAAHPYDPPATLPATAAFSTEYAQWTLRPSQRAANLSSKLCSRLPIGDKRAFPPLTVSAPNRPPRYNSLQNRRDRGAGRRARRPLHSRPVRRSRWGGASPTSLPSSQRAWAWLAAMRLKTGPRGRSGRSWTRHRPSRETARRNAVAPPRMTAPRRADPWNQPLRTPAHPSLDGRAAVAR